jgi:hypothetical protein
MLNLLNKLEKLESHIQTCFNIDDNLMIAIGCDPLSPKQFIDNNKHNSFIIDLTKGCKKVGNSTVYFAKKTDSKEEVHSNNSVDEDNLIKFKVLELWPETMGRTGIKCMLGRLSEIKHENFGLPFDLVGFDHTGSIFVIPHDCELAFYLRNDPEEIKKIDLDKFLEGNINMKGQSYKAYYFREYLIEAAKQQGEYFHYNKNVDQNNVLSKFVINLKKAQYQISGRPENGDYSLALLDSFFDTIDFFFKTTIKDSSDRFVSKSNGMLSLEVIFQNEPAEFILTNLSSFGFSLDDIQQVLRQMRDQIIN